MSGDTMPVKALAAQLARIVGRDGVLPDVPLRYLEDATSARGVRGRADIVVLPQTPQDVAAVLAWCYENDVPITPRGGGTGYAGGAVPVDGGVVLGLERLSHVRAVEPLQWRMQVAAGVPTAHVRRLARENGLVFPPDPGAAEQSQIGGNIATNAGGPHAFKYGVTGRWITGLEVALAPGELIAVGGAITKDVSGYDLKSLIIGSEGTLGIVTGAWLRLLPAPEVVLPVVAVFPDAAIGTNAIERIIGWGLVPAALDYLDEGTLSAAGKGFPAPLSAEARFMVICEADGSPEEALRVRDDLVEALDEGSVSVYAPDRAADAAAIWRWRESVPGAVDAVRGGKISEDIVVPLDRLREAIEGTVAIAQRHGIDAVSWGHAGDGNLHSTFLVSRTSGEDLPRAESAAAELFQLAIRLGGTLSGEHGIGLVKRLHLSAQWSSCGTALQERIKRAFDPKGLLNPAKKLTAPSVASREDEAR